MPHWDGSDALAVRPEEGLWELYEIVRHAADYWESIFPYDDEFYVTCVWEDRGERSMGRTTAGCGDTDYRPDAWTKKRLRADGSIGFRIKFQRSDDCDYFMDATPEDDSEFDMEQTLYDDQSAGTTADWLGGVPSPYFEVSYAGTAPNRR
jgi:hypothetical protein